MLQYKSKEQSTIENISSMVELVSLSTHLLISTMITWTTNILKS